MVLLVLFLTFACCLELPIAAAAAARPPPPNQRPKGPLAKLKGQQHGDRSVDVTAGDFDERVQQVMSEAGVAHPALRLRVLHCDCVFVHRD
jgi:hypothetical protein